MSIEEIYNKLEFIIETYKAATKETFESETKNGKKLFNSILNLMDEMGDINPSGELFDDDEYFSSSDFEQEEIIEIVNEFPQKIRVEDLLEDNESII